jgi:hypothetical protein
VEKDVALEFGLVVGCQGNWKTLRLLNVSSMYGEKPIVYIYGPLNCSHNGPICRTHLYLEKLIMTEC